MDYGDDMHKAFLLALLFANYSLEAMDRVVQVSTENDELSVIAKKMYELVKLKEPPALKQMILLKILTDALKSGDYSVPDSLRLPETLRKEVRNRYKQKHAVTFFTLFPDSSRPSPETIIHKRLALKCPLGRYLFIGDNEHTSIHFLDKCFSKVYDADAQFAGVTSDSTYALFSSPKGSFFLHLPSLKTISITIPYSRENDLLILHANCSYAVVKNILKYSRKPSINGSHPHAAELEELSCKLEPLAPDDYIFGDTLLGGQPQYGFNRPLPVTIKEIMNLKISEIPPQFLTGPNSLICKVLLRYLEKEMRFYPDCSDITPDARYGVLAGVDYSMYDGEITRDGRMYNNNIFRIDLTQIGTPGAIRFFQYASPGHIEHIDIGPDGNTALVCIDQRYENQINMDFIAQAEKQAYKEKHFAESKVLLFDLNTGKYRVLLEKEPIALTGFYKNSSGFYIWDCLNNFYSYSFESFLPTATLSQLVRIIEFEKMARVVQDKKVLDEEDQIKFEGFLEKLPDGCKNELGAYFNLDKH